jgi:hypothetical protein
LEKGEEQRWNLPLLPIASVARLLKCMAGWDKGINLPGKMAGEGSDGLPSIQGEQGQDERDNANLS